MMNNLRKARELRAVIHFVCAFHGRSRKPISMLAAYANHPVSSASSASDFSSQSKENNALVRLG